MARRGPNTEPQRWKTGPDPVTHTQYRAWVQQRNQALWRAEGWAQDLDFDTWREIWADKWADRGRQQNQLMMTRQNTDLAWSLHNVHIITRAEHNRAQTQMKMAGQRSLARQRQLDKQRETLPVAELTAAEIQFDDSSTHV